jgi:hypothetical protein
MALRKLGRLGAGREPRTADQADVLAALQGLYRFWIDTGTFGRLADVIPLADITAGENQRIIRDETVITVTLPEYVPAFCDPLPYGALWPAQVSSNRDYANRPPHDGSVVQIKDTVAGNVESWIYDGTRREWVNIDALQLDEEAPRSGDYHGLAACLAAEIADEFGAELGVATQGQAARFVTTLTHHLSTPRRAVAGVFF